MKFPDLSSSTIAAMREGFDVHAMVVVVETSGTKDGWASTQSEVAVSEDMTAPELMSAACAVVQKAMIVILEKACSCEACELHLQALKVALAALHVTRPPNHAKAVH